MAKVKQSTDTKYKNFQEYITANKLSAAQIQTFITGKKFKVIQQGGSHNYGPNGTVFTANNSSMVVQATAGSYLTILPNGGLANGIAWTCIQLASPTTRGEMEAEIDYIQKEIDEKFSEIEELKSKLSFMEENGLEGFDEDQFKVFTVLQTLKTKKSDIEKAKIIAQLVKP